MPRLSISRADLLIFTALPAATFAAYSRVATFGFLGIDDGAYVKDNIHLPAGMAARNLRWIFLSFQPDNWFPVTRLSLLFDYRIFRLNPAGYHLENVLLHSLAALLLFGFLLSATGHRLASAFVAFVFALHPLHVESVAWVSERKDVLCAFFWFATLWAWLRYIRDRGSLRYLSALVLFALGLMSKPMIVTLPLLLLLLDVWPLARRGFVRPIVEKVPFLALSASVACLTVAAQHGAVQNLSLFPLRLRVENALITIPQYLADTLWPARLWCPYAYPDYIPLWQTLASAVMLIMISVLTLLQIRVRPYLAVGWFWFLGTLIPVIGLVQVGDQGRADRYMYVPMAGLLIMMAWGAGEFMGQRPRLRSAAAAFAVATCLALGVRTFLQTRYWKTTDALFRHSIAMDARNYLGWQYLGQTFMGDPNFREEVIKCYQEATLIRPDYVPAINNLGIALMHAGRYSEAIGEFEAAMQIDPGYSGAHYNLGATLQKLGRKAEALREFETAVRITPDFAKAQNELGANLWNSGQAAEGLAHLQLAVRLDPDNALAQYNLGGALLTDPVRLSDAISHFTQALEIDPRMVNAHIGLATALWRVPERKTEAISHLRAAQGIQPDANRQKQIELLERELPVVPR